MFFCQESSPSLFFGSWVLWRLTIFQCFCLIRVEWLYLQFTRRYVSKFSKYVLIQSLLQIWDNQFRGSKASDLLDSGRIQQNMWSSMHRLLVQSRRIRNKWLVFFFGNVSHSCPFDANNGILTPFNASFMHPYIHLIHYVETHIIILMKHILDKYLRMIFL